MSKKLIKKCKKSIKKCKKFMNKMNKKLKKITHWDIALLKIGVVAFALLVAKLWSPILSLAWYWYAIIFIVPYIILIKRLELVDLM